ncbi:MAG: putative assembly protein [Syntrophorhabdus sp. PtaU1.Bin058]|nr:MAG: putative assembly protein [Syntrophorhabdus sp. PtaU1.Bin058]
MAETELGYQNGIIDLHFKNITIKGAMEGNIKDWKISMDATKGIYFKSVAISGFDITVPKMKEGKGFMPFPAELFEVRNGTVTYNGLRFSISEIVMEKMNIGQPFTFRADIGQSDYFERIEAAGGGTYKSRQFDIKGTAKVRNVDLERLAGNPKGKVDISGNFTLRNKRLILDGQFGVRDFEMNWQYLKKPVYARELRGDLSASVAGSAMDIKMKDIFYKDAPFEVALRFEHYDINEVGLSSGFLSIGSINEQVGPEAIGTDMWNFVRDGKAKIRRLSWVQGKGVATEIELKDLAIAYKGIDFQGVGGLLSIGEKTTKFTSINGFAGNSRLYDFSGTIADNGGITAKGRYSVDLLDIPSFLKLGEFQFVDGVTDGSLEISGKEGKGYRISGAGELRKADVRWKKVSVSASGSYRFVDDEITFDPLTISKGSTNITIRGKWKKGSLGLLIKGNLDTEQLRPFIKIPLETSGLMGLDMGIRSHDGIVNIMGSADMEDVYFELLGYMKKDRGIGSKARFEVTAKGGDIYVHDLRYTLDIINLDLKGKIEGGKKVSMDLALDVDNVARIAHLFFFNEKTARGDIALRMSVRDLSLPVRRFPYMVGSLRVRNGFLRLPWLKRPLRNIDLTSDFKGDDFDIVLNGFACGKSTIRKGELHVKGRQSPQFSLSVDMNYFNPRDFRDEYEGKLPVIGGDSITANMTGNISVRAKTVEGSNIKAEDLEISGVLSDRKISVDRFRANALGGQVDLHGIADLSGDKPHVYVNGRLSRIKSGLFFKAFGAKNSEIEGSAFIYGNLTGAGDTLKSLISKADGNITLYSRDGVIKRWNLLAKTFGVLNIYDLFRGKADLAKDGLAYTKMGATFIVTDGVFQTDNFLIDSPSMVVTGKGNLNLNTREINAGIQIAPLVTLDRTIDKIPILRNILKRKGGGFLYMACDVSGPIDDPAVKVSFTNTIGGKTLEILRNMLFLPVEVFD